MVGGRDNRSSSMAVMDPSRLTIDPLESDRIDMRGGMVGGGGSGSSAAGGGGGSISNVIRAYRRPPPGSRDYDYYDHDDSPTFLLLIDDGLGGGEGKINHGGSGAYATRLVVARNGIVHDVPPSTATRTTSAAATFPAGPSESSSSSIVLPRVSCAAYHPDSGYVGASGTGVFGLHHPEVVVPSYSSSHSNGARHRRATDAAVPFVLYLGCDRALPLPGPRTSSAGGHQDMALCCSGRVAILAVANAFYGVPCCLCVDVEDAMYYATNAAARTPAARPLTASRHASQQPSFPTVSATRIASFAQSSQVHPVIAVEIVVAPSSTMTATATMTGDHYSSSSSSSSSFSDVALSKYMRPITSLVFLASGRECTIVDITSTPVINGDGEGGGVGGGIVPTAVRSSTRCVLKFVMACH